MKLNGTIAILLAACLVAFLTGCDHDDAPPVDGYFKTPFQTESEFVVTSIVTDLAEQIYFAARHTLPDKKHFWVRVREGGGTEDAPQFEVTLRLDKKHAPLKMSLTVDNAIWSSSVYADIVTTLAQTLHLAPSGASDTTGTEMLGDLMDGTPETIERNNQALSSKLAENFTDASLHEQAAFLLGMFILRDHSGYFFDLRFPLSRLTAHLAMARFLGGLDTFDVNGRLAEAIMYSAVNDGAVCTEALKGIDSTDASVLALKRVLQTESSGDWRILEKTPNKTMPESVALFISYGDYVNASAAWSRLNDTQKKTIDFVRAAYAENFSVGMGHDLAEIAIPLEIQEVQNVYQLWHGKALDQNDLAKELNVLPEYCFTETEKKPLVRVIGWGQWANFLQRHLGHSMQSTFELYNAKWGVPDYAKQFATNCDHTFSQLRLYPFIRYFQCTDTATYHQAVDDGSKIRHQTPQLVPMSCWGYLDAKPRFESALYRQEGNPHGNEWQCHNPLPGTVYDLHIRLFYASLLNRGLAGFEKMHQLAPYDNRVCEKLVELKYGQNPTYDQAAAYYKEMTPWSVNAGRFLAKTVSDDPAKYEDIMAKVATLDSSAYFNLASYEIEQSNYDGAAQYYEKAEEDPNNAIQTANVASGRVRYYMSKGNKEKAKEVADYAGEVYSYAGLEAKGLYMEYISNYDGAFEWYGKVEERYNAAEPLLGFWLRYREKTADMRFDSPAHTLWFPNGEEKASLNSFHNAPKDGVLVEGDSEALSAAGMKKGDVIMSINGDRVRTWAQYVYFRETKPDPQLDLVVWQGSDYREIKASPPNRRFGVSCGDYRAY